MLATFFEKFDLFADVPTATAKLRDLVLQLALRGRLVASVSCGEEVGSVADFRAAVIALANSRGLRAPRDLAEQFAPPFTIPSNWKWMSLADVGVAQTGTTPIKNDRDSSNGEVPFIKPADILPNTIDYENQSLTRSSAESGSRLAPAGSLLMVCIGTIGKCNLIERECAFNQQINCLSPVESIDPRFLLIAARAPYFQKAAWRKSSSTTIAILNKAKWVSIPIPIPPLSEQRRIVTKVKDLMILLDTLESQRAAASAAGEVLLDALVAELTTDD